MISNRYPPHMTGGYEVSCQLAAEGLERRGHDVSVLTSVLGTGRPVTEGRVRRWLHLTDASPAPARLALWEYLDGWRVARLIAGVRPQLISVWNLLGVFPSALKPAIVAGVPVVYHLHDVWMKWALEFSREWADFWRRPATTSIARPVKALLGSTLGRLRSPGAWPADARDLDLRYGVFCSEFAKRHHEREGFTVREPVVVYNGVDTTRFVPGTGRGGPQEIRLLCVGRLCEEKGIHTAVHAFRELVEKVPDGVSLTVMGVVPPSRDYYRSLQRFVCDEGLEARVSFRPPVVNEEMPSVYNDHDVLILPSFREGLPRAVLEAMACGLTVVSTTSGGTEEILRPGEDSLIFPAGDAGGLARELERVVKDPQLRQRLAAEGHRVAQERFSVDRTVSEIERYMCGIVERESPRAAMA